MNRYINLGSVTVLYHIPSNCMHAFSEPLMLSLLVESRSMAKESYNASFNRVVVNADSCDLLETIYTCVTNCTVI